MGNNSFKDLIDFGTFSLVRLFRNLTPPSGGCGPRFALDLDRIKRYGCRCSGQTVYTRGRQPWSWRAAGCAGFRCYSVVNLSIKADDYAVNSPHLVLGSELIADLKAKTKSSTPCGSLGTGLPTPGLY